MSLENFQCLDKEPFDNSIEKRDFLKVYNQQGSNLNDSDQNVEFIFGENNNFHQIGNSYLEFDITVRRNDNADFDDNTAIRLVYNGFAYVFRECRLSTTSGSDLEHNKFVGQVSTSMRSITSKDDDLLSQFDNFIEEIGVDDNATSDNIRSVSLNKPFIINNHSEANRGKIQGHLHLEHILGFCKRFKKITKNLGFDLTFKTANRQDII